MPIHSASVIVLRAGETVDRISRPPRTLPDGSVGVEYMGLVYPIIRPGEIEADGPWYYTAQAPICLDTPSSSLEAGVPRSWLLDTDNPRPYLFLNGPEEQLYDGLRLIKEAGFIPERWGPSFYGGEGGVAFDWFIRFPHIETAAAPSSWELQQLFAALESPPNSDASRGATLDPIAEEQVRREHTRLAERIIAVERDLATELQRRDAAEAGAAELRRNFDRELKRANEAASFLRAALAHSTTHGAASLAVETDKPSENAQELSAAKADLANALEHWLSTEEALQNANNELASAKARSVELEILLAEQPPKTASVHTSGRIRSGLKELETTLAVFAPSILLMRDSAHFITIEVADRSDLYEKLRALDQAPQSVRSKRVHAAEGWLELHFSTGLARDGRMYFKKLQVDGRPLWGVLISDKAAQPRDFAWIASQ